MFDMVLIDKLKLEDNLGFRNFTTRTTTDFEQLLLIAEDQISLKEDTKFGETIPPSLQLAVTLRFLTGGYSFTGFIYIFRISKQLISQISIAERRLTVRTYV